MKPYSSLASWWPLVSCVADYAEEAEPYWRIMSERATRPIETMLELGCGGGNNASFLKAHCRMTLTDFSPEMLAVSRELNPECEHIEGDMRTLQLGREFDAVFTHDAIMHMRTEDALREAMDGVCPLRAGRRGHVRHGCYARNLRPDDRPRRPRRPK